MNNMLRIFVWCVAVCFSPTFNVFSQLVVITSAVPGGAQSPASGGAESGLRMPQYCDQCLLAAVGEECFERNDDYGGFPVYELRITSSELQERFDELIRDGIAVRVWITPKGVVAHLRAESVNGLGKSFRIFYQRSADGEVDVLHSEKSMLEHVDRSAVDAGFVLACCFFLNVALHFPAGSDVLLEHRNSVLWWCRQYGIPDSCVKVNAGMFFEQLFSPMVRREKPKDIVPVVVSAWGSDEEGVDKVSKKAVMSAKELYELAYRLYKDTDYRLAYSLLSAAVRRDYAPARWLLGVFYENGYSVKRDECEAVRLYRSAADQGIAEAQYNLGLCYDSWCGVDEDANEAVRWYRLAADQGYAPAQNNLGVCYDHGYGVDKDESAAVRWYRLAAKQGYLPAQENLASHCNPVVHLVGGGEY